MLLTNPRVMCPNGGCLCFEQRGLWAASKSERRERMSRRLSIAVASSCQMVFLSCPTARENINARHTFTQSAKVRLFKTLLDDQLHFIALIQHTNNPHFQPIYFWYSTKTAVKGNNSFNRVTKCYKIFNQIHYTLLLETD